LEQPPNIFNMKRHSDQGGFTPAYRHDELPLLHGNFSDFILFTVPRDQYQAFYNSKRPLMVTPQATDVSGSGSVSVVLGDIWGDVAHLS
jgi:hypothetical protein